MTELVTKLKKVKGLGSAKDGTNHWWLQRVTGIAMIGLLSWFMYSFVKFFAMDFLEMKAWVKTPINSLLLVTFFPVLFFHAFLGFKVVVEDYVHKEFVKILLIIFSKIFFVLVAVASVLAILFINFKV